MQKPAFQGRTFGDTRVILVPSDLSTQNRAAIEYAVTLARALQAEVHVLHVDELRVPAPFARPEEEAASALSEPAAADLLRRHTTGIKWPLGLHHRAGNVFAEILGAIEELGVDLVIMGVRRKHQVTRFAEGRVWARVARSAPCPVLVLPMDPPVGIVEVGDVFPPFSGEDGF